MPSNLHLSKANSPDEIIVKCAVKNMKLVINFHTGISGAPHSHYTVPTVTAPPWPMPVSGRAERAVPGFTSLSQVPGH